MRLLVRRIYRAFPELDGYSDEQCIRFVASARQGAWRKLLTGLAILSVVVPGLAIGIVWSEYLLRESERFGDVLYSSPPWLTLAWMVASAPGIALGPAAALLVRDRLLRRLLRHVLRGTGRCPVCSYNLIGLSISSGTQIVCPECGTSNKVDPSLGELVIDSSGTAVYQPSVVSVRRPLRILTPGRVRILKRVLIVSAIVLFIIVPAIVGGYEIWLNSQAARAARERPGADTLLALVEQGQPPGVDSQAANAWDAFERAYQIVEATDARVWRNNLGPGGWTPVLIPEFAYVSHGLPEQPLDATDARAAEKLARELIEHYRADGVYAELSALAACRRAVGPPAIDSSQPFAVGTYAHMGKLRNLARINAARMAVAAQEQDLVEYVEAFEANLAIARMLNHQKRVLDSLVGVAIEALTYSRVRALLVTHPSDEWLDAVESAVVRQRVTQSVADVLEGEQIATLNAVAWVFADPERVRWGRLSPSIVQLLGPDVEGRLGTYNENRDVLNKAFAEHVTHSQLPRLQRPVPLPEPQTTTDLLLIQWAPSCMTIAIFEQADIDRLAVPVLSALERFRNQRGDYPQKLDELLPGFLEALPIDPWSGSPFGYTRIDPGQDSQGRSFLLYSAAADSKDDGGKEQAGPFNRYSVLRAPVTPDKAGVDFIVNDSER